MTKVVVEFGVPGGSHLCAYCGKCITEEQIKAYIDFPAVGGVARYHYSFCPDKDCWESFKGRRGDLIRECL